MHSTQSKLLDLLCLGLMDQQRSAEKRDKRNYTHSPICQLAPELLGRILFFAQIPQGPIDHARIVSSPWIEFDRR
jgi:hypothetical protein